MARELCRYQHIVIFGANGTFLLVVITRDVGEVLYSDEDVHDEINDDRDVTLKVDVGTSEPDSASALLVTSEIVVSLAVPLT